MTTRRCPTCNSFMAATDSSCRKCSAERARSAMAAQEDQRLVAEAQERDLARVEQERVDRQRLYDSPRGLGSRLLDLLLDQMDGLRDDRVSPQKAAAMGKLSAQALAVARWQWDVTHRGQHVPEGVPAR